MKIELSKIIEDLTSVNTKLEEKKSTYQEYFDSRSESWQESDKGIEYEEKLELIEESIELLENSIDILNF